jgi:hypothetical protein
MYVSIRLHLVPTPKTAADIAAKTTLVLAWQIRANPR